MYILIPQIKLPTFLFSIRGCLLMASLFVGRWVGPKSYEKKSEGGEGLAAPLVKA